MPAVSLSPALRSQYEQLFNTAVIRPERVNDVAALLAQLLKNRGRYEGVQKAIGVPWFVAAVIHNMESSQNFSAHLHNGDPLTARTVQVPAGRPKTGSPPFTWEASAADALQMKGLSASTDWSLAGVMFVLERYNGWGYRNLHPDVLSPYLWSGCQHYTSGKFVRDGLWSDTAVSKQIGAAVLLRRWAEQRVVEFVDQPAPKPDAPPQVVPFAKKQPTDAAVIDAAKTLQTWLNTFNGIFVKVDGFPGEKTSDAFKQVTGNLLPGDPRAR